MKQKTFILRDKNVIKTMLAFLDAQPENPVLEAVIREHKKKREVIQNSLYWLWITVIANELGTTKEDQHHDLKKRILVPIYERDDLEFCEMLNTLRNLYTDGYKQDSKRLYDQVVKMTSTTTATVKQFAEYLTEVERDMIGKGIILPHKEDLYYESLGIKH